MVRAYMGLTPPPGGLRAPKLHLVADMTSLSRQSGGATTAAEEAQLALARRWSSGLMPEGIPSDAISLVPFDRLAPASSASRCAPPQGSWAASALDRLRARLESDPGELPTRVILIADIEQECEADLCQAGQRLVAAGAWLDLVALGEVTAPECLQSLRPESARPGQRVRQLTAPPPRFRIERVPVEAGRPEVLASGIANGQAVRVESGLMRVIVELETEEPIGPFSVADGERAQVRIQSFPLSARSQTSWVVDIEPATGRASN